MSHFTVMVVTQDGREESVAYQLAPFHEYECTGTDDEFVQDVDVTAEYVEKYNEDNTTRLVNSKTGENISYFGKGYDGALCRHELEDKEGWEIVRDVPIKDVMTFKEYVMDYCGWGDRKTTTDPNPDTSRKDFRWGYVLVDEKGDIVKLVDRTNPNAKWDWWVVGGRWFGKLIHRKTGKELNTLRKGDLDIETLERKALDGEADRWRIMNERIIQGEAFKSYEDISAEVGAKNAKEVYWNQPVMKRWGEFSKTEEARKVFGYFASPIDYAEPEDVYLERKRLGAISAFAFLRDRKWAERGNMSWFACVSNEKKKWEEDFRALFDAVPDDHFITIVDCHI